ncbi:MAG TPA: primosomal protein N', partial [Candidatus Obscuribacterales bacterium]
LDRDYLGWLKWVADYYLASLSQVIGIAVPRRLSGKVRNVIKPVAEAAVFLRTVEQAFGQGSRLYEFAVYLISSAPHWKSRQSCLRQFGRRSQEYLQLLQKHLLIEIFTEVQQQAEAKEQLMVTLTGEPEGLSLRQRELLKHLRSNDGQALLSEFCQEHHTTPVTLRRLEGMGAVAIAPMRVHRRPLDEAREQKPLQVLTPGQQAVFDQILNEIRQPSGRPLLLHGVTGSGKTEVYLHSLAAVLALGGGGMFLVPEIALTPQMLRRCRAVFGDAVAVLHSELSAGEYRDEWDRIRDGVARVVVGARSAIFAPVPGLKLIVVDEEHESSYKQDSSLRYDARLLAQMRMQMCGGLAVFGSATPRMESYEQAQKQDWLYLSLPDRIHNQPLPPIYLVDMRQEQDRGNLGVFSQALKRAMDETLAREEQAILLLNRRGYTGSWLCRACGEALRCQLCAVSLTYHRSENRLKCHYCDYHTPVPRRCPLCHSDKIQGFGLGTQKLEEITQRLFPSARI